MLEDPSIIEFKGQDPSVGSRIVSLFPTFVATKHLDVINLRFATPIDHERVEVHYAYFAHADDDEEMVRSEEHTSELQSLMRNSYAVFCLKKKKKQRKENVEA